MTTQQQTSLRSDDALKDTSALLQLEKRLATLLGWTDIDCCMTGMHPQYKTFRERLPRWTGDDAAAFQLMVEHDCFPVDTYSYLVRTEQHIEVSWGLGTEIVKVSDYADKGEAVRVAICRAVIAKLESVQ